MIGSELAKAMVVVFNRRVNVRESTGGLDKAIETTVSTTGRFNEMDVLSYLEAYKAEMLMRDIPEDRRLSQFPGVVTPSIHAEVLEV